MLVFFLGFLNINVVLASDFRFTNGTPSTVEDGVISASDTFEQSYFSFIGGMSGIAFDSTAVDTSSGGYVQSEFWF